MEFYHSQKEHLRRIFGFEKDKDPQGILWGSEEFGISREEFRLQRLRTYNSYRNLQNDLELENETRNEKCNFFEFKKNHPVKCEYSHFQLRNNVRVVNESEIYLKVRTNTIVKYNPIKELSELVYSPSFVAVSYDIQDNFLLIGGMEGELALIDTSGCQKFSIVLSTEDSRITNSVKIFTEQSKKRLLVCNNDKKLRIVDPETQENLFITELEGCVNDAALNNDQTLIATCLDSVYDCIVDRRTETIVSKCVGHTDYGFSVDWDPSNPFELATGNQDLSVMVWDIRNTNSPIHVLHCILGSGLGVKYSKNGKYLTFAESADFFSVVDKMNIKERQILDYFGEISGFGILEDDPGNLRIFLGMGDPSYWSLVELHENSQTAFLF